MPPALEPLQRALLQRRSRQLRKANDSLARGARRRTPEVRKLIEDIGGSAAAMGLERIAHTAAVSRGVAADKLSVYGDLLLTELDAALAASEDPPQD